MIKFCVRLVAAVAVCFLASSAWATVLVGDDPFNYTSGAALLGQTYSGTGTATGSSYTRAATSTTTPQLVIGSGSLTAPSGLLQPSSFNDLQIKGVGANDGGATRLILNQTVNTTGASGTGVTVFYSFLLQVNALTGSNNTTGGYFFALNNAITNPQTTNPTAGPGRMEARIDPTDATKFDLGIFTDRAAPSTNSLYSSALTVGQTYFVVGEYSGGPSGTGTGHNFAQMWINPDSGTYGISPPSTPTTIDNTGGTTNNIASLLIRQSQAPWLTLDDLRVGTSWAEVTPPTNPVLYWDTNNTAMGSGGPTPNGTWDGSTANWNADFAGALTPQAWTTGARAVFSAGSDATGAYTVTVTGTQDAFALAFKDGNPTLTGGTVNLTGSGSGVGVVDVVSGTTATIASSITGSVGLTKTSPGTLVLSGTNTYTGTTTISGGTIQFAKSAAMAGNVSVSSGTTMALNVGGTGEFNNNNVDPAYLGNVISGNTWAASGATLALDSSHAGGTFTYSDSIGNFGGTTQNVSVKLIGTGTTAFGGANTYSGGTNLASGTLEISSDANLGDLSGAVTYSGASTLRLTTSMSTAHNIVVNAAGTLDTPTGTSSTYAGSLSGTNTLIKGGNGTLTVSTVQTFTGTVQVAAGTLALTNSLTLQNAKLDPGTGAVVYDNSVTTATLGGLTGTGNFVLRNSTAGDLNGDGFIDARDYVYWRKNNGPQADYNAWRSHFGNVPGATLNLIVGNNNTTSGPYTGALSGPGSLTKTGTGTQTLSGNNTYTGGTTINAGTLQFGKTQAMSPTGNVTVNAAGTLGVNVNAGPVGEWNDSTDTSTGGTLGSLIAGRGGQGTANQVIWTAGSSLGIDTSSNAPGGFTYIGNIGSFYTGGTPTDNVNLVKRGTNSFLYLTGTSSFSGQLKVENSGGVIGIYGSVPNAGSSMAGIPTVSLGNADAVGIYDTGLEILANNALPANSLMSFGSSLVGSFNGGAASDAPSCLFQLYDGTALVGTVPSSSFNQTVRGLSGGNARVKLGTGTLTVNVPEGESYAYTGTLRADFSPTAGTGTLIKTGRGKQTWNQIDSNFNGDFILQNGTVGIGDGQIFGGSGSATARLIIEAGGADANPLPRLTTDGSGSKSLAVRDVRIRSDFAVDCNADTIQFLGNAGTAVTTLETTNPTIFVNPQNEATPTAGGTFAIAGKITDGGTTRGFTKAGKGMLVISAPSSDYKGETVVQEGYLRLIKNTVANAGTGQDPALGDPTAATNRVVLAGGATGATLTYNGSQVNTGDPRTLVLANKLRVSGTGTSTISYNSTTTGLTDTGTDVTGVTFQFSADTVDWTSGALTFLHDGASQGITFRPTFSGSGFVYDGPVVIDNGGGTRKVVLQSTNSTGNQTWNGDMTYNPTNGVATYLRAAGGTSTLGGSNINVNISNTGGVIFDRSSTAQVFSGAMSGAGSLTKNGTANLTLSGASTYTGSTTLNNGRTLVNGSLTGTSGVAVTGATLGGTGTINTSAVNGSVTLGAGGNLAPGASAGKLTMNLGTGSLDLSGRTVDSGALQFELGTPEVGNVDTDNDSDHVVLTAGTLNIGTLDFADFAFTALSGFGAGTYTLFDANSAITGSIGSGTGTIGGFSGSLSLNGSNDVVLTVTGPGAGAGLGGGAVPEPTSLGLLAFGLVALSWRRTRR